MEMDRTYIPVLMSHGYTCGAAALHLLPINPIESNPSLVRRRADPAVSTGAPAMARSVTTPPSLPSAAALQGAHSASAC